MNYYSVDIFKTFRGCVDVMAESEEEAMAIAHALNDNDDCYELEYSDDENRIECYATETLPPEKWAFPGMANFVSRADVSDEDYEFACSELKRHEEYWVREHNIWKEHGVKEYLEKQGK